MLLVPCRLPMVVTEVWFAQPLTIAIYNWAVCKDSVKGPRRDHPLKLTAMGVPVSCLGNEVVLTLGLPRPFVQLCSSRGPPLGPRASPAYTQAPWFGHHGNEETRRRPRRTAATHLVSRPVAYLPGVDGGLLERWTSLRRGSETGVFDRTFPHGQHSVVCTLWINQS